MHKATCGCCMVLLDVLRDLHVRGTGGGGQTRIVGTRGPLHQHASAAGAKGKARHVGCNADV